MASAIVQTFESDAQMDSAKQISQAMRTAASILNGSGHSSPTTNSMSKSNVRYKKTIGVKRIAGRWKPKRKLAPWMSMKKAIGAEKIRFKSQRQLDRELYSKKAKAYKIEHPNCLICMDQNPFVRPRKTEDVHHTRGRKEQLLLDEKYWMPVCRQHHDWIHRNPRMAWAMGWLHVSMVRPQLYNLVRTREINANQFDSELKELEGL